MRQSARQQHAAGEASSLASSASTPGGAGHLSSQYENAIHLISSVSNVRSTYIMAV